MRLFSLLISFFIYNLVISQTLPKMVHTFEKTQKVWIDQNENTYLINSKNELLKYSSAENLIGQFSDFKLNSRTQLYTISPFKTILFYPEYGEIITFDNSLSEIARVNYFDIGLMNISAIGISQDYQSIWVFDPVNQNLNQYNQNYIKLSEGEKQINMIGQPIFPSMIYVRKTNLYLYNEEEGFYVFDIFGNFIKPLNIQVGSKFQIINSVCYYLKENTIHTIDLETLKEEKTDLVFKNGIVDFYFSGNLLGIIDKEKSLTIYKL